MSEVRLYLPREIREEVRREARRLGWTVSRLLQWSWRQAQLASLRAGSREGIADAGTIRRRLDRDARP